jgi:DNA polymerase-1
MPEQIFLIDAHAHIFQAFYAIKGLTGPDGSPVNAVYGFARLLRKIERDYEADYMAVAFDPKGEVFRHDIYEEYKATRKPTPEALNEQIPVIKEMLRAWGIPILLEENYEADDVLCSAARKAAEMDLEAVIVTTDKDVEQCIDRNISVLHLHKSKEEFLDVEGLREKRGIEPWQVVEMMALAGDNSDNIPGVYRIGVKTASDLIREFGSVEELYENLEEVSGDARRKRLAESRDQVELSRRLVTINDELSVDLDLEQCQIEDPSNPELVEFYRALGFESLIDEEDPTPAAMRAKTVENQGNLFDTGTLQKVRRLDKEEADYTAVRTIEGVRELSKTLRENAPFSVDLETTSLDPRQAKLVGIAVSWQEGQGVYVACAAPEDEEVCPPEKALEILAPVLEDPEVGKIGQNLKYDMLVLMAHGVGLRGIVCDTLIASYLLDPSERTHGLDDLAKRHLNYENIPITELIGKGKSQITMDRVAVRKVVPYACEDADIAFRLAGILSERLEDCELLPVFKNMELPLIPVLAGMEWQGINIDQDHLRKVSREFEDELKKLEQKIHSEAGAQFNVNSPQQLSTVLFEKMGLPTPRGKKTTTGYSTAHDVLEDLAGEHPIAEYMLRYRKLSKLKSTYADALLEIVDESTGRLHTSFNQTGTATGRLSSSEPNLQNIPVRTATGRQIRKAFIPSKAHMLLLSADYSQVELRILAHCSGDETLQRAFNEDRDIHRFVAAQINEVPEEEVTPEMRQRAKAVNFGIIYGQTPYGLSAQIDVSVEQAQRFIDSYFDRYPRVREFIGRTVETARREEFVRTLSGRRRRITGIRGSGTVRSAAERIAVNSVIQGTAADLIKLAMIAISNELAQVSDQSNMLLQIHDELVFEVPEEEVDRVQDFVVDKMTNAMELSVPIQVDVATGKNWEQAK